MNTAFSFKVTHRDKESRARSGIITTPHGILRTPCFTPVATRGSVRGLSPEDLHFAKTEAVLGNTYHLYLSPGLETLKKFGGFAPFMKWEGPTLSDSGGYQVSFMWNPNSGKNRASQVKITDEGARFRSHRDGSLHLISPEISMQIQDAIGADIIMAFDQPLSRDLSEKKTKEAFRRTLEWEERSFIEWEKIQRSRENFQALYGIVQGEFDEKMRNESLSFVLKTGFPGIAIGGETIGSDPSVTARALDLIASKLPDDKPVHALGLGGGPEGIFEAVSRGVDTFDNTSITRMARTGLLLVSPESGGNLKNKFRIAIKKSQYKNFDGPIDANCDCYSCRNFSLAYVRHLQENEEFLGIRLASIHNIHFINTLMTKIRESIGTRDFNQLKRYWYGI